MAKCVVTHTYASLWLSQSNQLYLKIFWVTHASSHARMHAHTQISCIHQTWLNLKSTFSAHTHRAYIYRAGPRQQFCFSGQKTIIMGWDGQPHARKPTHPHPHIYIHTHTHSHLWRQASMYMFLHCGCHAKCGHSHTCFLVALSIATNYIWMLPCNSS